MQQIDRPKLIELGLGYRVSPPADGVEVAPLAGLEGKRADDGFLGGVGAAPVACPALS